MISKRAVGHAPKTTAMAQDLAQITGPCIGCTGCQGVCRELIEAISVPDAILSRGEST